jgi:quercetin dioxygenase-like cupin family protein
MRSARRYSAWRATAILALSFALGATGCAKEEPAEEVDSSRKAGQSTGDQASVVTRPGKPFYRPAGTGPAVWGPGDLYTFLATGEETNNAYFQFEAIVPPGGGPPPHIHRREDESFYLAQGTLEMRLGDSVHTASAGDFVNIPRGTVHRFINVGSGTAKMVVTFVPAGMDRYFQEVFPVAEDRTATPPPTTEKLIERLKAVAPKYGIEFVPVAEPGRR